MPTPHRSEAVLRRAVSAVREHGSVSAAARVLGMNRVTLQDHVDAARAKWPDCLPPASCNRAGGWAKVVPKEKPRIRVKAGSSNSSPTPETPPDPLADLRVENGMQPAFIEGALQEFKTGRDNTFTFGACGDQHLCSKYERLDVLEALYDAYVEAGCKVVLNTGNWVDGEARFNVHDLHTRGMDAQLRYLARVYPKRPGITTYAVTGDDHEGWYSQREGVDIGRYAERCFRDAGRKDWVDLGYMEAPTRLVNANSGRDSIISVVHPGGGSSYALSYSIQKIIESLDGGEKPAVGVYGHYHKLWSGNIRNVWCIQTGCAQDQTPFMRKKKIEAHVGGCIVKLTQDPNTGAITRCSVEILRFFNRGYYANRWSHHGPIAQAQRVVPGVAA